MFSNFMSNKSEQKVGDDFCLLFIVYINTMYNFINDTLYH